MAVPILARSLWDPIQMSSYRMIQPASVTRSCRLDRDHADGTLSTQVSNCTHQQTGCPTFGAALCA